MFLKCDDNVTTCICREKYFSLFSTTVSVTAVLIQSVRGEQTSHAADFRSLGNVPLPLHRKNQIGSRLADDVTPPPMQDGSKSPGNVPPTQIELDQDCRVMFPSDQDCQAMYLPPTPRKNQIGSRSPGPNQTNNKNVAGQLTAYEDHSCGETVLELTIYRIPVGCRITELQLSFERKVSCGAYYINFTCLR